MTKEDVFIAIAISVAGTAFFGLFITIDCGIVPMIQYLLGLI